MLVSPRVITLRFIHSSLGLLSKITTNLSRTAESLGATDGSGMAHGMQQKFDHGLMLFGQDLGPRWLHEKQIGPGWKLIKRLEFGCLTVFLNLSMLQKQAG